MRGPETRLRKKIVKKLEDLWPLAYIRKIHGNAFQNIGLPDLLCCIDGSFIGLEIKCPGKKATPAQILEGERITRASGHFAVVTSTDEAILAVEKGLKKK